MLKNILVKKVFLSVGALFVAIVLIYFFTARGISQLAIITGLGVDYKDGEYTVTFQFLTPAPPDSAGNNEHIIVSSSGKTVDDAFSNVGTRISKLPNLDQCRVLFLGKGVCDNNIMGVISALQARNIQHRMLIMATDGEAKEIFKSKSPLEPLVSAAAAETLLSDKNLGTGIQTTLRSLMATQSSKSQCSLIPLIKVFDLEGKEAEFKDKEEGGGGEKKENILDVSRTLAISNGKSALTLDSDLTKGFCLMYTPVTNFTLQLKDVSLYNPDITADTIDAAISVSGQKIKYSFENNVPSIRFEAGIKVSKIKTVKSENNQDYYTSSLETLPASVVVAVEKKVSSILSDTIRFSLDSRVDYLNLNERFFQRFSSRWSDFVSKNPNFLSSVSFSVSVSCDSDI